MLLQIRHIPTPDDIPQFVVVYDGKQSKPVSIKSPWEIMVGTQTLQQGLQWYLEEFLKLPEGFRARAENVQAALSQWGRGCFDALFEGGQARDWYRDAQKNFFNLKLEIVSNDAAVLSWPWEALKSSQDGCFQALQCLIQRRLDSVGDILPLSNLPDDELNVLYIIARPKGDVLDFQTQARPLIDFAKNEGWPIHIDVLRPPTFKRLEEVLEEKPYHIVHFDGHGNFNNADGGVLVFENDDGDHSADFVSAGKMGELLRRYNIPVMVFDACKSAAQAEKAKDPFASVAVSLLKAGVHSIVANSYSIYASSAKIFVPAFYKRLLKTGSIADAVQAGRREMFGKQERDTYYGKISLQDWIVPVLYQHEDDFLPRLKSGRKQESALPIEIRGLGDYGFIGRDSAIHQLERAIRRKPAGILIHGTAGEGKTTLTKGFLQWLEDTNGLGNGAFWFSFEDIRSADYIVNTLADALFWTEAMALPTEQKLGIVTQALRDNCFFIIWDNFELVSGIPGTEVYALLPDEDREMLKHFLNRLKGGKTKVLITSRSREEDWLPLQDCYRLPLGGLQGEELWQYCNAVVSDLGLTLNREDKAYHELLKMLAGNPLAIRAILLRLAEPGRTASQLVAELENAFNVAVGDEENKKRLQAALSVFGRGLDSAFAPVLRLLGLHEHFADADLIDDMLKATGGDTPTNQCFAALERAGFCRQIGNRIYQLHPALRSFLARLYPANEDEQRAFVDVMGSLADTYTPKQLHDQRGVFALFGANFHRALRLALDMRIYVLALTQALAAYAKNTRNFSEADRMFIQLAEAAKEYDEVGWESPAYHQLGNVALTRRELASAEEWYKKSLDISLKHGDEHGAARTYHQLGRVVEERREFAVAEEWYKKSLDISLKQGNEHGAALTYHQLGVVALERRELASAEEWYKKSLDISLKQGDEHSAASTYHQLGRVAEERREFAVAEEWYSHSSLKQAHSAS